MSKKTEVVTDVNVTEDNKGAYLNVETEPVSKLLEGVSLKTYDDRPNAWTLLVAGFASGRNGYGVSTTLKDSIQFADQVLVERDRRFPNE